MKRDISIMSHADRGDRKGAGSLRDVCMKTMSRELTEVVCRVFSECIAHIVTMIRHENIGSMPMMFFGLYASEYVVSDQEFIARSLLELEPQAASAFALRESLECFIWTIEARLHAKVILQKAEVDLIENDESAKSNSEESSRYEWFTSIRAFQVAEMEERRKFVNHLRERAIAARQSLLRKMTNENVIPTD